VKRRVGRKGRSNKELFVGWEHVIKRDEHKDIREREENMKSGGWG
jgi:hypothetical protein